MREQLPYGPFLEEWRDIKDYEGFYQISNYGRIKSLERYFIRNGYKVSLKERILRLNKDKGGYIVIGLSNSVTRRIHKVHQLVAIAFLGHVPCGFKRVVNHIFFDKTFNVAPYLEITTQRENANKKHLKSSSKYTGVCFDKDRNKWAAYFNIKGKTKHLGRFDVELDASEAYQTALANHLKQTA